MIEVKTNLQVIILVIAFFECESAALLRTPKVYNALITTDQNLTPSRAYPVIQPTIHDSPFIYGPYGYTPYSYYDPFAFNPFESAAFVPKYNADGTVHGSEAGAAASATNAASAAAAAAAAASNGVARSASEPSKDNRAVIHGSGSTEKSPIPLNEFGFPPSLIPLSAGNGKNPINLAPFSYNSYPLIYDQFAGYPQAAYLPHFGVIPQTAYGSSYGGFGGTTQAAIGNENITPSSAIDPSNIPVDAAHGNAAGTAAESQNNNPIPDVAANVNGPFGDRLPIDRERGNTQQPSIYFDRENGFSQDGNGGIVDDNINNSGFRTAASNNNGLGSINRERGSNSAQSGSIASNGKQINNNQDSLRRTSSSTSVSKASGSTVSSVSSNGSQHARFVSGTQNGQLKA